MNAINKMAVIVDGERAASSHATMLNGSRAPKRVCLTSEGSNGGGLQVKAGIGVPTAV